jgi:hypothetical protein
VGLVLQGVVNHDPQAEAAPKLTTAAPVEDLTSPDLTVLEGQKLFPLMLPVAGVPLGLDLAGWEQGVQHFFARLDALGDDLGDGNAWLRLAPWCALAGAMAAGLEIARRHLSRSPPPGLMDGAGRGLAWRWPNRPDDKQP